MYKYQVFLWDLLMHLLALDSISAYWLSYAETREGSPVSISTSSKRQVDRLPVPRENETSSFKRTWVAGRFSAVRHWFHDVFIFNTDVTLVTISSIWVEPGVCPKVEHMEGYFFSPFHLLFFLILQPLLSHISFTPFFNHTLGTSNSIWYHL